jgi:hypothetical protein
LRSENSGKLRLIILVENLTTVSEIKRHAKENQSVVIEFCSDSLLGDFAGAHPLCERRLSSSHSELFPVPGVVGGDLAGLLSCHASSADSVHISPVALTAPQVTRDGVFELYLSAQFHVQFLSALSRIRIVAV